MCFYNDDYDWYASVQKTETHIAGKPLPCHECGRQIAVGESLVYIYLQEHEECQRCEWEELGPDDEPCDSHDYGEIYHYRRCDECDQILKAIQVVEQEEGCPAHAQQPNLEELGEVFMEHESREQYALRAVAMYPALAEHRFLAPLVSK